MKYTGLPAYTAVTQGSGNQCHNARRDEVAGRKRSFFIAGRRKSDRDRRHYIINTAYLRYTRALATV